MASGRGCLKVAGFGCLGMIGIVALLVALVVMAQRGGKDPSRQTVRSFEPPIVEPAALDTASSGTVASGVATPNTAMNAPATTREPRRGRLVLDIAQGGFTLEPGRAGEGVQVEAQYDTSMYELREDLAETDSTWVYTLRMRKVRSGMSSFLYNVLHGSGGQETKLNILVPPDIPVALEVAVNMGGFEAEIGGLWISSADVAYGMGGFTLSVAEPLREPMERLAVKGSMGGFEGKRLGNASPRHVDVNCSMGGADLDLRGLWRQDCDLKLTSSMGGMGVRLPEGVRVEGLGNADADSVVTLQRADVETPLPVLRFEASTSMGGIEVER